MSELFSIQLQNQQQSRDGVWLDLPTTTEQVQAALRQIDISSDNPQGLFISGYFAEEEKRFAIPYNMVLASNVDELNFLASRLETLSTGERAELNAALQAPQSELSSIGRITDFPENVDYYVHLPDVRGPAQLGDYYLNRSGMVDGVGIFFAISPIIALVARMKKGYWLALIFAEIYSFAGLFASMSQQLKTVYPMTAVFNISGYYNANMFQVLIGVVILMVCVILSLLILKGLNRKTK